jgi:GNAT superfamily N-acetyltransferase
MSNQPRRRQRPGDARLLDELAANAWPAHVVQVVGGWRLRVTPGVRARRSSSVLPLEFDSGMSLEAAFQVVDGFYRQWGETVRYQISPAAKPANLDGVLAERGFGVEAAVHVQTAALDDVLERAAGAVPGPIRVTEHPDPGWLATSAELFQRSDSATIRERILDRIGPPVAYALLELDGVAAAVGMGVLERGWLGIFSMGTKQEFRQRGAARAVLTALSGWATHRGADRAYLQVEEANEQGHRLYEGAGFQTAYGYHYRTAPPQ